MFTVKESKGPATPYVPQADAAERRAKAIAVFKETPSVRSFLLYTDGECKDYSYSLGPITFVFSRNIERSANTVMRVVVTYGFKVLFKRTK